MMHQMRGERRVPYISVTTSVTYESEEQIESFKNRIIPYCDEVGIGKTKMYHVDVERMNLTEDRKKDYEQCIKNSTDKMCHMTVCPEIWDKLSINWDGSVSACCQDYDNLMLVGNILEDDLHEIFIGKKIKAYREIIKNSNYDQLVLCRDCYEYIPLKH